MTLTPRVTVLEPRHAMEDVAADAPCPWSWPFRSVLAGALAGSLSLREFVAAEGTLTHAERVLLVHQAPVLVEDEYVPLPLKPALHAVSAIPEASGDSAGASPRVP